MSALVVIGAQWGDEGKGKIVDLISAQADLVVRYAGGANAGHTLRVGDTKIVTPPPPSDATHPPALGAPVDAGARFGVPSANWAKSGNLLMRAPPEA